MQLEAIGVVRSPLTRVEEAPRQRSEGAPRATLAILPKFHDALHRVAVGDELILLTWLDRADRRVLQVHPMDELTLPLTGVFATRSSDRPNPIGLHRVRVLDISGDELLVDALEVIDGTPIVDIKCVLD